MSENKTSLQQALQRLQAGDWEGAHRLVAAESSQEAAWLHAHLHRIEGDLGNARYWYGRAGRPEAQGPLEEERQALLERLT